MDYIPHYDSSLGLKHYLNTWLLIGSYFICTVHNPKASNVHDSLEMCGVVIFFK